ncbi:Gfo/Idh/MocA family protein [Pedobacter puniceum]|uniref:Gfo/Idh/MocA family oxidoreductase n=1 Tax=Pedobacter puniceum TaxID=2666136 RepID=A0A7K0FN66_9SPHI|nr:Gfo/Idh/MocA family oxidoreductase [Pedobacter puniceum]MRX47363.1 gfo/Idh/MocA family oxidoreductase [Pedobacter puniceum]
MTQKVRWGILSTAKIATDRVLPALKDCNFTQVDAICSRNLAQAQKAATLLGIEKAYGTYEELLNDADIDAIYIPLPNHLHVEWSIKCLEAGKHVLCEKPIGLSSKEAQILLEAAKKYPHLKVMEGFMYRFHPQWIHAKELVNQKWIGDLKVIQSFFSYYNVDPQNIRNQAEIGGGGLMDIGCYCISLSRFLFDAEPLNVVSNIDYDLVMKTDIISSGMMQFANGVSSFTCSTQLVPYQRVNIIGDLGRIEIEIPFNAKPLEPAKISLFKADEQKDVFFDITNQYTLQFDAFSKAILDNTNVPTPLEDAVNNMKVIEAMFASDKEKCWKNINEA